MNYNTKSVYCQQRLRVNKKNLSHINTNSTALSTETLKVYGIFFNKEIIQPCYGQKKIIIE